MQPDRRQPEFTPTVLDRPEVEGEQGPIDFARCRTLEDVMRELKRMAARSETLPTSDGQVKLSPARLAKSIEAGVSAALAATRDPGNPTVTRMVDADQLDEIFAQNGITSTAGLRETLVRVMRRKGTTGAEFHALSREIQQQGEFNPVNRLSVEDFVSQYPRGLVPAEIAEGMSDTERQVVARWSQIEGDKVQGLEQQKLQQLREWQDARSRVGFRQEWITPPTSTDHYAEYARAQAGNRLSREASEAEAHRKHFAEISGVGDRNSIGASIARVMGAARAQYSYEGLNWVRGADGMPEPKMTRTFALPIDGAPGHMMTITLFSGAEIPDRGVPRELPEHFQGVLVESVDQLSTLAGAKATTPEQRHVVALARAQMKKATDRIRAGYGIDLGIDQKLASLVQ